MNATASRPRIAPLAPPYSPDVEAALTKLMPKNVSVPPLGLFRTLTKNVPLSTAMQTIGSFFLRRKDPALPLVVRELVILRVCARCRCAYEWGVHVAAFGQAAGLSQEKCSATWTDGADAPVWSDDERAVVSLVDELHDTGGVTASTWHAFADRYSEATLLELISLAGWYHAIAYVANAAQVAAEPWAPSPPVEDARP